MVARTVFQREILVDTGFRRRRELEIAGLLHAVGEYVGRLSIAARKVLFDKLFSENLGHARVVRAPCGGGVRWFVSGHIAVVVRIWRLRPEP